MTDDDDEDEPPTPAPIEDLRYRLALLAELERIVADRSAEDFDGPPAQLH